MTEQEKNDFVAMAAQARISGSRLMVVQALYDQLKSMGADLSNIGPLTQIPTGAPPPYDPHAALRD